MDKKILDGYNSPEGAASYTRKFERHWTERINNWHERRLLRRLLRKTLNGRPIRVALDLPCGYGRLYPILREFSEQVIECDWSHPLLSLARERRQEEPLDKPQPGYVRATAFRLPFRDGAFDLVLSVRLCHHIRSHAERIHYVRELMRVSGEWTIFTYFDQHSLKNRLREWRRRFTKKRPKWTLSSSEIEALAQGADLEVVRLVPLSRLFSGHRYALLRRNRSADLP